jgi:hypothetical protein
MLKTNYMSPGILHDFFRYEDGNLIRIKAVRAHAGAGKVGASAGSLNTKRGRFYVVVEGVRVLRSRAVWVMHHGPIPDGMVIDHINRIKTDDRIENLRLASSSQNSCNQKKKNVAKSGLPGVYPNGCGRWFSHIKMNGKQHHLGTFETKDEAHAAYVAASKELHGAFSCHH